MKGGFARFPVFRHASIAVLLLLTLSGCGLFLTTPPPDHEPPLVSEPEPEPASEPEVAPPPAASEPEPGARHAWRRPRPAPVHRHRPPPPPAPPPAPPPPPAPAPIISTRLIEHATFRTLLDAEVQRPDGKVIGRAVNFVAGPNGKPADIVVNLQGFMGIGDRKAMFPWNTVRVNTRPKTPAITLVLGRGQQPVADKPRSAGQVQTGPAEATPTRLPLIDASVERPNGSKIGRVVDVLLGAGAIPLAIVLDLSGTLQQRRTFAADWSALRFVTRENELRAQLDMTDQQIDASPPYASDQPVRAVSPAPAASSVPARGAQ